MVIPTPLRARAQHSEQREDVVQSLARSERGARLGFVRLIVPADVDGFALGFDQLFHDRALRCSELGGDGREMRLELAVLALAASS